MKTIAKLIVVAVLGSQVRRLRRKNNFKIIAVVGSVGKTSTKFAIAKMLGSTKRVRYQEGNYNDIVSVPLVFFGQQMPKLTSVPGWLKVFAENDKQLKHEYPYDFVVLELGTDGPGQIAKFAKYLRVDLAVITSLAPEHMQFFKDFQSVMDEETSVTKFSIKVLVNTDFCDGYMPPGALAYSIGKTSDYKISGARYTSSACEFEIIDEGGQATGFNVANVFSQLQLYSICAGFAAARYFEIDPDLLAKNFKSLDAVPGRMQRLAGIGNSTILDDSYNALPLAMESAIKTIYSIEAPQRLALLGNMNELGEYSQKAHAHIGSLCDPAQLDLVITLGPDSNKWLAAAAEAKGCKVIKTDSPMQAGEIIKQNLKAGALILVKGSQNGVFSEEAIKPILKNQGDATKLVRQTPPWLAIKQKTFQK